MSYYNKELITTIAKILRSKILLYKNINTIFDYIIELQNEYKAYSDENINSADYIFKLYLFYGNIADIVKYTNMTYDKITDILVCRKSKDITLTLLVKTMYSLTNSKYNEFLRYQINIIIEYNNIDMKQAYIDYCLKDYDNEEIKQHMKTYSYLFDD